MPLLIGMDEAGYGPNLGPLVVTTTSWLVPDTAQNLWTCLSRAVRKAGERAPTTTTEHHSRPRPAGDNNSKGDGRLVVDDSKRVCSGARGRTALETTVLAFVLAHTAATDADSTNSTSTSSHARELTPSAPVQNSSGGRPRRCRNDESPPEEPLSLSRLCRLLDAPPSDTERKHPWWTEHDPPLPCFCDSAMLEEQRCRLQRHWSDAGVKLLAIRSRLICPEQFNALLRRERSKAELLSHLGIDLLRQSCEQLPPGPTLAVADKHGGRNYYRGLLQDAFPNDFVFCLAEGRRQSQYRIPRDGGTLNVRFQPAADAHHLPVALASMVSKYLRELCMHQLNRFWTRRVDGLKPTAGYPADAPRFWNAIRPLTATMGIPASAVWRER